MKFEKNMKNMYGVFDSIKEKLINDLSFVDLDNKGDSLLLFLSDINEDVDFLIHC